MGGNDRPRKRVPRVKTLKRHLTVANVLSLTALFVALSATAVAATKLAPGQVKAVNIASQAVTNAKIKTQAVTSGKIKNGGVNATDIANGAVISSKLATGAVISSKLGKKSVTVNAIGPEAVTGGKLGNESVSAAKLSASLYAQLIKNVTYVNGESASNNLVAKSAEAVCPAGKQAIGGGARVNGELQDVAVTGSNPTSVGTVRTGWSAFARDVEGTPGGNWSIEAFAVCAEL
ncbi:MAG: hypothetical protein WD810_03110 [Solirubrobacterales bacterium]